MNKLYYIFLIINERIQPIPAKEIKQILLEKYNINIDIKTIHQAVKNINEFFTLFCHKQLIKIIRGTGFCIEEEFFDDGQLQYLLDSIIFNKDINDEEANLFLKNIEYLSSAKQLSRININQMSHMNQNYHYLLNLTTIIKAIHEKKNIYFKYVNYEIKDNKLIEIYRTHGNDQNDNEFYIVSPYKIIQRESKYYLLGYFDYRKNTLSIYRLDRMRLVRNHKSQYIDIQEQYDFERELDKNVNMYLSGYRDRLEICFDISIIREIVDRFGMECHVQKTYENKYVLVAEDVLISEGLIGWLMMLQDKVEVIAPIKLKDDMLIRINRMKSLYELNKENIV